LQEQRQVARTIPTNFHWYVPNTSVNIQAMPALSPFFAFPLSLLSLMATRSHPIQAPSKPTSPVGQLAAYYLQMQPHLFEDAVQTELEKLERQRGAERLQDEQQEGDALSSTDMVLYRCAF
jgi:hypothetical protein